MTIMRISSTYNSGYGGAYWGWGQPLRQQGPDDISSIWDNMPTEDSVTPGVYYAPKGASYVPMDQVMTAPFGANADLLGADDGLGNNYIGAQSSIFQSGNSGFNPFAMSSMFSMALSNRGHGRSAVHRGGHESGHSRFLSLTHGSHNRAGHGGNIFKNGNSHGHDLNIRTTNVRNGSFGRHTTSIHTPSVDFNTREVDAGNRHLTRTNISGHINSFKQTNQHISGFGTNLNRTRQVIDTPTETITRTRTRGVVWV